MKCTHCGANLDPSLPYCQVCGAPNPDYTSADYDDLRAETDDLTDYSQDAYDQPNAQPYEQPAKREKQPGASNTLVIVVAIVCAAAVVVAALYFFVFRNSSTSQSSSGSSSIQSESPKSQSRNSSSNSDSDSDSDSDSSNSSSDANWMNRSYILPNSTSEYLSSSDISGFSAKECNYALNEIYAREGRRFKATELQNYFDSKSWYNGTIDPDDFDEDYLSGVEKDNVELLKNAMNARGGYTPE